VGGSNWKEGSFGEKVFGEWRGIVKANRWQKKGVGNSDKRRIVGRTIGG